MTVAVTRSLISVTIQLKCQSLAFYYPLLPAGWVMTSLIHVMPVGIIGLKITQIQEKFQFHNSPFQNDLCLAH